MGAHVGAHGAEDEGGDALLPFPGSRRQFFQQRPRQLQPNGPERGDHGASVNIG
jgi:hypothetical protein